MTTPAGIDRDAPVIAHHAIDIAAPLDTVWNLHTDVDAWPVWNLEVTAAKLDGAFAPGNSFTWTSYDFTVTSTIYIVEDPGLLTWCESWCEVCGSRSSKRGSLITLSQVTGLKV
jgi:hypothetical protein